MDEPRRTAIIACRDDAHGFLLASLVDDTVDEIVRVESTAAALDLVLDGERPELVLLDVALQADADAAAAAARLRLLAHDAVVLEVGEDVEPSGDELARRLRGNSVEAYDWVELRGP